MREPYQQPLSVYLCQILEEQPDIFYAASVFYAVPVFIDILNGTGLFDTGNQYVRCESVEGKKVR